MLGRLIAFLDGRDFQLKLGQLSVGELWFRV